MNEMRKLMEAVEQLNEIKVNYDEWTTPPAKNLNDKHFAILKLMSDGKPRGRAEMIRSATRLDPNPRVGRGGQFGGWNKLDYDLYKKGLLDVVDVKGGKKIFKINAKGRKARDEFAPAQQLDIDDTEIETWFERDRGMVMLLNKETEEEIVEWWDEDLQQAIEDGFLDPKDFHKSAYVYAKEMRLV